ncbi:lysozyme inhibitor LprI family protein [Sphingomonas sp. XXL09]|uniref:lysozyme inhibitor LprI family protein n=1 Tax=Sphingomonas sp. XXL09 TaxID=3457787 RepID=UPI00406BD326
MRHPFQITAVAVIVATVMIPAISPSESRAGRFAASTASCARNNSGTEAEELGCALAAERRSAAVLEDALAHTLHAANAIDRQYSDAISSSRPPSLVDALRSSQESWRRYALTQCQLEGATSFGGGGTDILAARCQSRLNLRRAAELRATADLISR